MSNDTLLESPDELQAKVCRPQYERGRAPLFLRPLLAFENGLRKLLIRTRIDSRAVTFSWFAVGLIAHGITAIGSVWGFIIGALLVYVKIALDVVDGELGRYQKRFMTPEDDIVSHAKGIYLDRIQHAIEAPLWGLALGVGGYGLVGSKWLVLCGVVLAIARVYWRFDPLLRSYVLTTFRDRAEHLHLKASCKQPQKPTLWTSARDELWSKALLWVRNGKRFNLAVLFAGCVDAIAGFWGYAAAIPSLLVVGAIIALLAMAVDLWTIQLGDTIVNDLLSGDENGGSAKSPFEGLVE